MKKYKTQFYEKKNDFCFNLFFEHIFSSQDACTWFRLISDDIDGVFVLLFWIWEACNFLKTSSSHDSTLQRRFVQEQICFCQVCNQKCGIFWIFPLENFIALANEKKNDHAGIWASKVISMVQTAWCAVFHGSLYFAANLHIVSFLSMPICYNMICSTF